MTKHTVSFEIDTDRLTSFEDSHLHALWHIAQANPAPHGNREAGELAGAITAEIVRRWLADAPVDRFSHQPADHVLVAMRALRESNDSKGN